jgi:hypothetical protein
VKITNYKLQITILAFVIFYSVIVPSWVNADPRIPEKLLFNVYWLGIKAGSASLEMEDTPDGMTITSRANSADFISIFYKVEDMAQSVLYPDGYPAMYVVKIREGRHRRNKASFFSFDVEGKKQKVIFNNVLDNERVEFSLDKKAYDPLSAFYEIRKRNLIVGKSEYIEVFDNKKLWNVEVQVLGKEVINTPAGKMNTIMIKPILKSEGIFLKKGDFFIWLTDDEEKVPVMVKGKAPIGSITAKLVEGVY